MGNPATELPLWDIVDGVIIAGDGGLWRCARIAGFAPESTSEARWADIARELYEGLRRVQDGTQLQLFIDRRLVTDDEICELAEWEVEEAEGELQRVLGYQRKRRYEAMCGEGLHKTELYIAFGHRRGLSVDEFSRVSAQVHSERLRVLDGVQRQICGLLRNIGARIELLADDAVLALFGRWMGLERRPWPISRTCGLTLREQLFCDNVRVDRDHIQLHGQYFRVRAVKQLPEETKVDFWRMLEELSVDFPFRLVVHLHWKNRSLTARAVRRLSRLRSSLLANQDERSAQEAGEADAALQSMRGVGEELGQGEALVRIGLQAVVAGETPDESRLRSLHLGEELGRKGLVSYDESCAHDVELYKSLPGMAGRFDRWRLVTGCVAGDLIPLRSYSHGDAPASLLLQTAATREPFGLNLRSPVRTNDNWAIFGASGVGKSVFVNLLLSYCMLAGRHRGRVIAVDYAGPEKSSFRTAAEVFGGAYICVSTGASRINPWPAYSKACDGSGKLSDRVLLYLTEVTNLLVQNLSEDGEAVLLEGVIEDGIRKVYEQATAERAPLYSDLLEAVEQMQSRDDDDERRRLRLAKLLAKLLRAPEAKLFCQPTNVSHDGPFVAYDLFGAKGYKQRVRSALAFVVAQHVRQIAFDGRPDRKKYVIFDEATNLLTVGMQSSIEELFTTARAHGTSVGTITQDYTTFRKGELSTTVNLNSTLKSFMSHAGAEDLIDVIADDFGMSEKVRETFRGCRAVPGEYSDMLLLTTVGSDARNHQDIASKVRVRLSPFDYQLCTSSAGDRAQQLLLQRMCPDASLLEVVDFLARRRVQQQESGA